MTAPKILPLTSVRFCAAFMVVLLHTLNQPAASYHFLWWGKFLNMGYTAVSFFFVLSGYILSVVYLRHGKPVNKRHFWIARIARIFPLYCITLLADTPHAYHLRLLTQAPGVALQHTALSFTASFFMLQAWYMKLGGINLPSWSISVETLFYLLFPWIGAAIWTLKPRQTVLFSVAIYVLGMAGIYALIRANLPYMFIKYNPILHLISFLLGIALARLHTTWLANPVLKLRLELLATPLVAVSLLLLAVITQYSDRIPYLLMHDGLLALPFAGLLLAFATGGHPSAKLLSASWLVVLGEASYGLYMIHIPLWDVLGLRNSDPSPITFILYLAGAIILSVISLYWFEAPMRRFILSYFTSPTRETIVTSSLAQ